MDWAFLPIFSRFVEIWKKKIEKLKNYIVRMPFRKKIREKLEKLEKKTS